MTQVSASTQVALLLTAPLIVGRGSERAGVLTPGEFKRLTQFLDSRSGSLADLIDPGASDLARECQSLFGDGRLAALLARGFQLSQAIERWQTRAIWVAGRGDPEYPERLEARLQREAPPVLYGCGDAGQLNSGGLAIVGSRNAETQLLEYARKVASVASSTGTTVISGGARGVDQAAMTGALEPGGRSVGVLPDGLEAAAMNRANRSFLMQGRLTLVSPYDPLARFDAGNAMQRNKLIYALADAALVVNAEYEKGGTWAGAVEVLEKLKFVPVYVRASGPASSSLNALRRKGALAWPEPVSSESLVKALEFPQEVANFTRQQVLGEIAGAPPANAAAKVEQARPAEGP